MEDGHYGVSGVIVTHHVVEVNKENHALAQTLLQLMVDLSVLGILQ